MVLLARADGVISSHGTCFVWVGAEVAEKEEARPAPCSHHAHTLLSPRTRHARALHTPRTTMLTAGSRQGVWHVQPALTIPRCSPYPMRSPCPMRSCPSPACAGARARRRLRARQGAARRDAPGDRPLGQRAGPLLELFRQRLVRRSRQSNRVTLGPLDPPTHLPCPRDGYGDASSLRSADARGAGVVVDGQPKCYPFRV